MSNEPTPLWSELYWHFVRIDSDGTPRLGYDDNREVRLGETLRIEGEPVPCERGLHASAKLWDAFRYAHGDKLSLCLVTLGGTVKHDDDKSVGNEGTVIAMLDADATEKLLRDWARWCALQVIHLWDAPAVVRQYLETCDESLRAAAWAAAWATARDAAGDAAWAAARAAARAAAWAAAWAAAGATARDAAGAAAWAAAWAVDEDAEIEKYAAELERRAIALMEGNGDKEQSEQKHCQIWRQGNEG